MRLLGEHFKRDGRPKRAFESWQEACGHGRPLDQKAYRCKFCGLWHLAKRR